MATQLSIANDNDYIPCLFYQGRNDKVMIHFHANGEDIGLTSPLMNKIVERLGVSIVCVEYPGYGIYKSAVDQRAKQILEDAKSVFLFFRDVCKVSEDRIIICGRSIGSGPACHLASTYDALALMLISPIKSVVDVARQKYGRIVDFIIEERFDNFSCARKVKCPTVIFHGISDLMVPHQSSVEMLQQGFLSCEACLFLREDMEHNKFNYMADIIDPLRYFLKINRISMKNKASHMTDRQIDRLRERGYIDYNDIVLVSNAKPVSQSQYFNNFDRKYRAKLPKKNADGDYLKKATPHSEEEDMHAI
jgi:abhydrolase domain-containing protein 17